MSDYTLLNFAFVITYATMLFTPESLIKNEQHIKLLVDGYLSKNGGQKVQITDENLSQFFGLLSMAQDVGGVAELHKIMSDIKEAGLLKKIS